MPKGKTEVWYQILVFGKIIDGRWYWYTKWVSDLAIRYSSVPVVPFIIKEMDRRVRYDHIPNEMHWRARSVATQGFPMDDNRWVNRMMEQHYSPNPMYNDQPGTI